MPFSGDTYTLPSNTCNPAVAATAINPTDFNALMADVEGALTTVKTLDSDKLSLTDGGTVAAAVTMSSTLDVTGAVALASTLEVNAAVSINVTAATDAIVTGGNITADYISATGGFIGNVAGNVTGNVTGNCTGSAGSVAWSGVTGKPVIQSGTASASATASATVTFATAFASTPNIVVTPLWTGGSEQQKIALVSAVSTTGFTVVVQCYDQSITDFKTCTGAWQVWWIAMVN